MYSVGVCLVGNGFEGCGGDGEYVSSCWRNGWGEVNVCIMGIFFISFLVLDYLFILTLVFYV